MDGNFIIREFRNQDHDQIVSLIISILEAEFPQTLNNFSQEDIDNIKSGYEGERENFFVIENNNSIIGTVGIKEDDKKTALMRRLFINPDYRGKGFGKKLIEKVINFCKDNKYNKIRFRGNLIMKNARSMLNSIGFKEDKSNDLSILNLYELIYSIK